MAISRCGAPAAARSSSVSADASGSATAPAPAKSDVNGLAERHTALIGKIDAVGSRSDSDSHGRNYRTQVINGFLGEMNSLASQEGVIVVGACNHPRKIDPAVVRAGRFDLKVEMPMPDAVALLVVLKQAFPGDVDEVAAEGYRALLAGEVITVPGVLNQAATLAGRATPKWLLRRISGVLGRKLL